MYPTIRDGEPVTVAPVRASAIARGDVVLFRHGRRVLAHRVVGVTSSGRERFFELRGDAKVAPDGRVDASAIVGKVVNVRRNRRVIPLCGARARARRQVRSALSRARRLALPSAAVAAAIAAGVAAAVHLRRR